MNLVPRTDPHTVRIVEDFISDRFAQFPGAKAVIGLSGGLDSALVLKLLVKVLGAQCIRAFFLPFGDLNPEDLNFAEMTAKDCGTGLRTIDIKPIVDGLPLHLEGMAKGNAMARTRMLLLYGAANSEGGLVVGTSNKSELLTGYFTKYGDGAADLYPIGDLLKTQVRELARTLSVPEPIIERPPAAGLLKGQTDEGELRLPYPILDQVLNGILRGFPPDRIADSIDHTTATVDEMDRAGFTPPLQTHHVENVLTMVRSSRHKRMSLVVPKVGPYTIGIDFRERW